MKLHIIPTYLSSLCLRLPSVKQSRQNSKVHLSSYNNFANFEDIKFHRHSRKEGTNSQEPTAWEISANWNVLIIQTIYVGKEHKATCGGCRSSAHFLGTPSVSCTVLSPGRQGVTVHFVLWGSLWTNKGGSGSHSHHSRKTAFPQPSQCLEITYWSSFQPW